MPKQRKILITSALPYANGPIHVGHLVEHCLTDFWARFQRLNGHECVSICADDTHGTPMMIKARNEGITPEELIARTFKEHVQDFADFDIHYDNYYTTHSEENRRLAEEFYQSMVAGNHLESRMIPQQYCTHDKMFLPDRFVKGTCPRCKSENQNGDNCDNCGATYETSQVLDPHCALCKNKPEIRETEHIYFKLSNFNDFLRAWIPAHNQPEVAKKLEEWLGDKLQDWCISRDAPYFGFEIPGKKNKYFYVWLDAPIGYISSTKNWADKNGKDFRDYWTKDSTELYHCIGKDIIAFHSLFWPVMLKTAGYKTPTKVFVHGMLTVDGAKMSKSKGTSIPARVYLKHLDPIYLRYYLACKLTGSVDDFDLSFDDFASRVNSDLIGKITNVASRGAQMLQKSMDGKMGALPADGRLLVEAAQGRATKIAQLMEERNFSKAMVEIRAIADEANKYFDTYEPWKLIKEDVEKTRGILTTILNLFRIMAVYLKPIIPSYVAKAEALFGEKPFTWDSAQVVVENRTLQPFTHLAQRMDRKQLDVIVEETKALYKDVALPPEKAVPEKTAKATAVHAAAAKKDSEVPGEIDIDDFAKIDLRVAKVIKAEEVPDAKKLLKLTLDVGGSQKTVFSGIKEAYTAAELEGQLVALVANLKPRKMKFGMSEGMILAAGPGGKDVFLIHPASGAKPGDKIS